MGRKKIKFVFRINVVSWMMSTFTHSESFLTIIHFLSPKRKNRIVEAHTEARARNVNIRCIWSAALWFGPFGLGRLTIFDCCLRVCMCAGECYRFETFNAKPFSINTHIYKFTKRVDKHQIYIIRLVEYYVLNVITLPYPNQMLKEEKKTVCENKSTKNGFAYIFIQL